MPLILQKFLIVISTAWGMGKEIGFSQSITYFSTPFLLHWFNLSKFSKNLKIQLWFFVLKPRLYLKIDFLHRFSHCIVWPCYNAYIDNLCPIFHYRTIEHLSDNIFKAFHCIRLNIKGFTAVFVSAILLIYKIQQKLFEAF